MKILSNAVFGLLLLSSLVIAEVPGVINYQGQLTDGSGNPVADGDYNIYFKIYDSATDGTILWTSDRMLVTVENGAFSVELGPFPPYLFTSAGERYLGIKVESDPEITPRIHFTTVPYAFQVKTIEGAAGGTIYGDVGINVDSAEGDLHIYDSDFATLYFETDAVWRFSFNYNSPVFYIIQSMPGWSISRLALDTAGNTTLVPGGGNVGIGQDILDQPARLSVTGLDPYGNHLLRLQSATGFSEPYLSFWYDYYNEGARIQAANDIANGASLRFHTLESSILSERMRITSEGRVGIGTASPQSILHIAGEAGVDGIVFPDGTKQTTAATSSLPSGTIVMWTGKVNAIPDGWKLCDGSSGTVDLTDIFFYKDDSSYKIAYIMKK